MQKVIEVSLEYGKPTVEVAIQKMKNALATHKNQGGKAVILIHGYGSSGVGGGIKVAVKKWLAENSRGYVHTYVGGEQWLNRRKEIMTLCKSIESYEGRIVNNEGVTVVILK